MGAMRMRNGRVYVIAEAGSCHDGALDKARALVEAAYHAGADAVKFQYWSSPERMVQRRRAPDYLPVYQRYAVPPEWFPTLRADAARFRLGFVCASYLPEDVNFVAQVTDILKVASFESADPVHLRAHGPWLNTGKAMIVSLGLGHRRCDVESALLGVQQTRVSYLHCVSAYPAPLDQLLLVRVRDMDGFSDHSPASSVSPAVVAVGAGARIIERHVKLESTEPSNPDAGGHACTPRQLMEYVRSVRLAERLMGDADQIAGLQPAEAAMARYEARSQS